MFTNVRPKRLQTNVPANYTTLSENKCIITTFFFDLYVVLQNPLLSPTPHSVHQPGCSSESTLNPLHPVPSSFSLSTGGCCVIID